MHVPSKPKTLSLYDPFYNNSILQNHYCLFFVFLFRIVIIFGFITVLQKSIMDELEMSSLSFFFFLLVG